MFFIGMVLSEEEEGGDDRDDDDGGKLLMLLLNLREFERQNMKIKKTRVVVQHLLEPIMLPFFFLFNLC